MEARARLEESAMGLFSKVKKGWDKVRGNVGKFVEPVRSKIGKAGTVALAGVGGLGTAGLVAASKRPHYADAQQTEQAEEEEPFELDMSGVEEALAQMAEYQKLALEASMREETPLEPLKRAAEVQDEARADTNRLQLLRRGLMSTFTRYGGGLGGNRQTLGV
jgi:hypothetical protein